MATELPFLEPLRRALGVELQELAGGFLAGEVPLSNDVVNRLVNRYLAQTAGPVSAAEFQALDGQRAEVTLSLRRQFVSSVKVTIEILEQPAFPHAPVLVLRWSLPGLGPLAAFAGSIVASFKTLPPGLRLEADRVVVNVQEALAARGLEELLQYIATFQVTTKPGFFVVAFALTIR